MERETEQLLREELAAARRRREVDRAVAEGRWRVSYTVAWVYPLLMAVAIGGSILVTTLLLPGCHDGCEPEDTRCAGTLVQVCASDGDWQRVEDCAAVGGGPFTCCESALVWDDAETAGCLPAGTCDAGVE